MSAPFVLPVVARGPALALAGSSRGAPAGTVAPGGSGCDSAIDGLRPHPSWRHAMSTRPRSTAALVALAAALCAPGVASAQLELVPMLGLADLGTEDDDVEYDASLAGGFSFGGRLARIFSLHGQVNLHPVDIEDEPGIDASALLVTFGVAGLFNVLDNQTVRLMVGPVIGGFNLSQMFESELFGDDLHVSISGPHIALQGGVYFHISDAVSLGPTFQFGRLIPSEVCVSSGNTETCDDDIDDDDGLSLLLVYASAIFSF